MKRSIAAFLAALITWALVATLIDHGLRYGLDGYADAEPSMAFSLGMMFARLVMGAVSSIAAGGVMGLIAPSNLRTPWAFGVVTLAMFIPSHVKLWTVFPLWYHLTFLLTIIPLVLLGWHLARARRPRAQLAASSSM